MKNWVHLDLVYIRAKYYYLTEYKILSIFQVQVCVSDLSPFGIQEAF